MKSRLINTVSMISQRLPRRFPRSSQTGLALTGAVCMLALSGCYYPYGYYPGGYYPYYATVPAGAAAIFSAASTGRSAEPAAHLCGCSRAAPARLRCARLSRLLSAVPRLSGLLWLPGLVRAIGLDRRRFRRLLGGRPWRMGWPRSLALSLTAKSRRPALNVPCPQMPGHWTDLGRTTCAPRVARNRHARQHAPCRARLISRASRRDDPGRQDTAPPSLRRPYFPFLTRPNRALCLGKPHAVFV